MRPIDHFHHCPKCGATLPPRTEPNCIQCGDCGYRHYFNPTVSVAAFVTGVNGDVLFIRRAKEPGKGKLAPPGGFVDFDETAEEALHRELREETGIALASVEYLCSAVNHYPFQGVTYPVLDLYFVAIPADGQEASALEDVESCGWFRPEAISAGDLAFDSMRAAFAVLLKRRETSAVR